MTEVANLSPLIPSVIGAGPDWAELKNEAARRLSGCGAVEVNVGELTVERFEGFRDLFIERPGEYHEAATPRSAFGNGVWSATDLPASQRIEPHNESSYRLSWPGRILFGCVHEPDSGGETLLTDMRAVLAALPPDIVGEFSRRGWCLVRNYHSGLGRSWQDAFNTSERSEVSEYCRVNDMTAEWREGDVLRTRQVRSAVVEHPVTREALWFNHIAFWHASSLPGHAREYLEEEFGPDGVPFATYYGDGGVIPDEVVGAIRDCFRQATTEYRWRAGALVLLDNMLVAHGRVPFTGKRTILVGMGDDVNRELIQSC